MDSFLNLFDPSDGASRGTKRKPEQDTAKKKGDAARGRRRGRRCQGKNESLPEESSFLCEPQFSTELLVKDGSYIESYFELKMDSDAKDDKKPKRRNSGRKSRRKKKISPAKDLEATNAWCDTDQEPTWNNRHHVVLRRTEENLGKNVNDLKNTKSFKRKNSYDPGNEFNYDKTGNEFNYDKTGNDRSRNDSYDRSGKDNYDRRGNGNDRSRKDSNDRSSEDCYDRTENFSYDKSGSCDRPGKKSYAESGKDRNDKTAKDGNDRTSRDRNDITVKDRNDKTVKDGNDKRGNDSYNKSGSDSYDNAVYNVIDKLEKVGLKDDMYLAGDFNTEDLENDFLYSSDDMDESFDDTASEAEDSGDEAYGRLPPEPRFGNVEYKLQLVAPCERRFQHLVTQLKWRLRSGGGWCVYVVGVRDCGALRGLRPRPLRASLRTLARMARALQATLSHVSARRVAADRAVAEVYVRKLADTQQSVELRVAVLGANEAGKSTLIGVLTQGELDNGRGSARLNMFRHLHEVKSGRTSSLSHEILGFDAQGNVVNYGCSELMTAERIGERSAKLLAFLDLAGHSKYQRTTLHGLTGYCPHYAMLVISATAGITPITEEHLSLLLALDVRLSVVITKCELAPTAVPALLETLDRLLAPAGKKCLLITDENLARNCVAPQKLILDTIDTGGEPTVKCDDTSPSVPVFPVSCVRGLGLNALHAFLLALQPPDGDDSAGHADPETCEFQIDEIFHVGDSGPVVGGLLARGRLFEGDDLIIGPLDTGEFIEISVKSIYRNRVPHGSVSAGQSASLGLSLRPPGLRPGMVLLAKPKGEGAIRPVFGGCEKGTCKRLEVTELLQNRQSHENSKNRKNVRRKNKNLLQHLEKVQNILTKDDQLENNNIFKHDSDAEVKSVKINEKLVKINDIYDTDSDTMTSDSKTDSSDVESINQKHINMDLKLKSDGKHIVNMSFSSDEKDWDETLNVMDQKLKNDKQDKNIINQTDMTCGNEFTKSTINTLHSDVIKTLHAKLKTDNCIDNIKKSTTKILHTDKKVMDVDNKVISTINQKLNTEIINSTINTLHSNVKTLADICGEEIQKNTQKSIKTGISENYIEKNINTVNSLKTCEDITINTMNTLHPVSKLKTDDLQKNMNKQIDIPNNATDISGNDTIKSLKTDIELLESDIMNLETDIKSMENFRDIVEKKGEIAMKNKDDLKAINVNDTSKENIRDAEHIKDDQECSCADAVFLEDPLNPRGCIFFQASVRVLRHSTAIYPGFQCTVHVGNVRQTAIIEGILSLGNSLRSGGTASVVFRFARTPEYLVSGRRMLFTAGLGTRAIGRVTQVFPYFP